MTITRFQKEWNEHAVRWGFRVETPFVVKLAKGEVTVPVLLRDFGASQGMLLVTEFSLIAPHADELVNLGYGYSCLSESTDEHHPEEEQALMEMLSDWGWSGCGSPPAWYREPTS